MQPPGWGSRSKLAVPIHDARPAARTPFQYFDAEFKYTGTVDTPQSGFPQIDQFLKVTEFCGDGRAGIQRNSFSDTEQILKVTGFQDPEAVRFQDCL
jgi:hypothetical protein